MVGVEDRDGDVGFAHGEDRLLVQDARAHIGKLVHLVEGDAANGARALDDARVGREEARDVRPVLVEVRIEGASRDGARDVAATTAEELDVALARGAIEAREHEAALTHNEVMDAVAGAFHVERPVVVEAHVLGGVRERKAQVLAHKSGGEVLAAAHDVLGRVFLDMRGELVELLGHGISEAKLGRDVDEALLDIREKRGAVDVIGAVRVDQIEEVSDLVVLGVALTRGRDHHEATALVSLNDALDLLELAGVCDARSAELGDLDHVTPRQGRSLSASAPRSKPPPGNPPVTKRSQLGFERPGCHSPRYYAENVLSARGNRFAGERADTQGEEQ